MTIDTWKYLTLVAALGWFAPDALKSETETATEFCLEGEFNLGARYQGRVADTDRFVPVRFCYTTEPQAQRVRFEARGRSNEDVDGSWELNYRLPDTVRIINRDGSPDVEFSGKSVEVEAARLRRMDPRLLLDELQTDYGWPTGSDNRVSREIHFPGAEFAVRVQTSAGKIDSTETFADFPLRGRVPVRWSWSWSNDSAVIATLTVGGAVMMKARGSWRQLTGNEAKSAWAPGSDQAPVEVPGDRWPARIDMRRQQLADGVHLVTGVRTGFRHMVVATDKGLIVADAPAGWVELHQLPASDLVPGFGISGLSENFIDFLQQEFPGQRIRAVVLSHAHDDHAGGARAFAAEGAEVYAPSQVADFLEAALSRQSMPPDRLTRSGRKLSVLPVADRVLLSDRLSPVSLVPMPPGPHAEAAVGIFASNAGYFFQSDLHVPRDDSDSPRADRLETECWFARWAVDNLPPEAIVINSHTAPQTPVSRLQAYLSSGHCGNED